uniref:adenosylmethionine decarboxylase n=1 Tax=Trieres chinensis TaxID=1514140 RepID=A0A7S2A5D5_TRICV|mmetsp:Transcript_39532/g.80643  ORF Transcript_39532/g.80643 Transcript_39532/m.80643 type:complete len:468 (+) Transcript_39532:253-1656(+)|eukprot:CAMPEP_0183312912 /NCGR_PEP_ID=MMETSP0160_2-20130417/43485_1 /TAXON_ID=2839 ORGANISM="Odontella Sinensis, Strain Grunow 1884" /NCGR_SAMPLE_ID=MMETSP0160_2 /ASSEMBLY_ACC=CAM_ASM_000250 /LENGTH=467 /DNA_ID=CAMNT_0025477871 /DNA_START=247 /DNA_END=1650 /DNA_ORIENTATION=+
MDSPHNDLRLNNTPSDLYASEDAPPIDVPAAIPEGRAVVVEGPDIHQPQQPPDHGLDDDDHSGEIREYSGVFEGPEKTLEVCFRSAATPDVDVEGEVMTAAVPGALVGLRRLSRVDLDRVCRRARCTILSKVSNQYLDAYVLSESSLFVYPYMLVLKTCGTTTLLRCLAVLIELGRKVGLELDWVGYSRKNFNFPGDQAFPHQSFHQELEYLYSHRNLCERLDGNGYTLGPVTGDHWFVFVADQTIRSKLCDLDTDRVLNIMMFDIDESVASIFYYDEHGGRLLGETEEECAERISAAQTKQAGIDSFCPGALIDPRAFEPCGYSMNAILFRSYYTMHITPEAGSSYASFETNQRVDSYASLINNVVRTFRPKRFVMTLMADEGGLKQMKANPLTGRIVIPPVKQGNGKAASPTNQASPPGKKMHYKRTTLASIKVEEDCCCMMGNWVLEESPKDLRVDRPRGMSMS